MNLIGLSPTDTFSGFQTSFFDSLRMQQAEVTRIPVVLPVFRTLCLIASFHPIKKKWGPRWSHLYQTSITAFNRKSKFVQKRILKHKDYADAIYQIGSLWDPLGDKIELPLFLQVDYTSALSKKGGWRINPGKEEQFWIRQETNLYRRATKICTTTENARKSIICDYGISPDKVVTVGAGVSSPYDEFEPERFPEYRGKKVFFVGKGDVGKGLDTLLDAFKIVKQEIPDAQLTLVGPTGLKINMEGVNYLGRVSDKAEVKNIFYQNSLFVMPSRFEPFGQVFIEAMSCKLPCIGTTVDAMPEIIEHNVTGYTIAPGDHKALAKYISKVLNNPDLARKMGRAGFERLKKYYTWPIVGRKIHDIIRSNI